VVLLEAQFFSIDILTLQSRKINVCKYGSRQELLYRNANIEAIIAKYESGQR
jgi:hypothetical protein